MRGRPQEVLCRLSAYFCYITVQVHYTVDPNNLLPLVIITNHSKAAAESSFGYRMLTAELALTFTVHAITPLSYMYIGAPIRPRLILDENSLLIFFRFPF